MQTIAPSVPFPVFKSEGQPGTGRYQRNFKKARPQVTEGMISPLIGCLVDYEISIIPCGLRSIFQTNGNLLQLAFYRLLNSIQSLLFPIRFFPSSFFLPLGCSIPTPPKSPDRSEEEQRKDWKWDMENTSVLFTPRVLFFAVRSGPLPPLIEEILQILRSRKCH